jgi:hypothetical protein
MFLVSCFYLTIRFARLSLGVLVCGLGLSLASAQTVTPPPIEATTTRSTAALPTVTAQAIRAHADFLSSDLLEGRATGSRGYELAAAYVAAQFRQFGLTPAGTDGGFFRSVPLIEATAVLPGSSLVLRNDGTTEFDFGKDYLPSVNYFNASSGVSAPMVFAGYGIEAPEYKFNDLADIDLQGKIAVILEGAPERLNDEVRNVYGWPETKYASLSKAGAIGVIEIHPNNEKAATNTQNSWERMAAMSWVSQMRKLNAEGQPDERFPELKLKFRLNAAAAAPLFANSGHPFEQVMQAAKAGEVEGFVLPGTVTMSATTGLRRMESNNVLGVIRGSDAKLQQEFILIAAHLDGLGRGSAINGDSTYNGLQRNAVGVAMMLEMARTIAAMPTKPKRSIVFAAVTAGEKGAQGLSALLSDGSAQSRNIVAALVLDTPLPVTRTSDVIGIGADQSSMGNRLVAATQQQNLRMVLSDDLENSVLVPSIAPLVKAGIPVLSLRGGNRARDGRNVLSIKNNWLQQHISHPSDDVSNAPLDSAAARDLLNLNIATLLDLANDADRPVWYRSSLAYRKLSRD